MTNNNYKTIVYSVSVELPKSLKNVFNHLVDLSKWWPEEFEGENIKLNSEFVFKTGDSHYSKNRVVEFKPDEKLTWLTTEAIRKTDNFDWTGSKMIFELSPKGSNTIITFTYDGIVFEDEYDRLVQICNMTLRELFYNYIMNSIAK